MNLFINLVINITTGSVIYTSIEPISSEYVHNYCKASCVITV